MPYYPCACFARDVLISQQQATLLPRQLHQELAGGNRHLKLNQLPVFIDATQSLV